MSKRPFMSKSSTLAATDRLFREYIEYLQNKSKDTLFRLLNALHSLADRLKTDHGQLFISIPEYLALKALRNHEHHGAEIKYVVREKSLGIGPFQTDVLFVCLISAADRNAAIEGDSKKKSSFRDSDRSAFENSTINYADVVDINPCIFNCIVRIFEVLRNKGLGSTSEEFLLIQDSYEFEERNGHSHFVTGRIACHPCQVNGVIDWMRRTYNEAE